MIQPNSFEKNVKDELVSQLIYKLGQKKYSLSLLIHNFTKIVTANFHRN